MTPSETLRKDKHVMASVFVCLVSLGGFLLWSGLAPLAEGVTAYGQLVVENDRKVVQHLEGGIIDEILVREGDAVDAGEPLMALSGIAASSGRDQITQDLASARAAIARLTALLSNKDAVSFSALTDLEITPDKLAEIRARQQNLFRQQERSLQADKDVLRSRMSGLLESADNKQAQIDSNQNSLEIVQADLNKKRGFLVENLISSEPVVQLERDLAQIQGELARLSTEQQNDRLQARDVKSQLIQADARFDEKLTEDLLEARALESEAEKRLAAAQDVVNRTIIYAPQSGVILNLKFSTKGGVVRAGEAILEIVPTQSDLIATVQISPVDRDSIYEGLSVRTRLSGLNSWLVPSLEGEVMSVSADLKSSPNGDFSYYEARVTLDAQLLHDENIVVLPGMPVEAFISSGQTRTFLNYLVEPISATFRRGGRT